MLGAQYGEELRSGKLTLRFDEDGTFAIWAYGAHKLPICPLTYPMILGHDSEALDRMSDRFLDLPQWRPQVAERALGLKAELAEIARGDGEARRAIDERVCAFNRDWRELDRLIAAQFWRVAFFRVAEDEINYRRFFNINDLAGLRMELAPVFEHAHARALRMLETREIDGLRIDHIDGLFDPKSYLTALRERVERPFYLVVEKILAPHERLRADWPVPTWCLIPRAGYAAAHAAAPKAEIGLGLGTPYAAERTLLTSILGRANVSCYQCRAAERKR